MHFHSCIFFIQKKSPLQKNINYCTHSFHTFKPCMAAYEPSPYLSQVSLGIRPRGERDSLQWPNGDCAHRKRAGLHAPRCQNTGGDTAAIWGERAVPLFKKNKTKSLKTKAARESKGVCRLNKHDLHGPKFCSRSRLEENLKTVEVTEGCRGISPHRFVTCCIEAATLYWTLLFLFDF